MQFKELDILLVLFSFFSSNFGCQTEWSPVHRSYPIHSRTQHRQQQQQQYQQQSPTSFNQNVQNNQAVKSEIKKREFPQDFRQLVRMWQQMKDFQLRNSQYSPDVAETQSNGYPIYDTPYESNRNERNNMNYGWNQNQNQDIRGSGTRNPSITIVDDHKIINFPNETDSSKTGDLHQYGKGYNCHMNKTDPNKIFYDCQPGDDNEITIKQTHDLWLNPFNETFNIDIKVPNYKINETINAHFMNSTVKQNINVWLKAPILKAEAATQKPNIMTDATVNVRYEKPSPRPRLHYSNKGFPSIPYLKTPPEILRDPVYNNNNSQNY